MLPVSMSGNGVEAPILSLFPNYLESARERGLTLRDRCSGVLNAADLTTDGGRVACWPRKRGPKGGPPSEHSLVSMERPRGVNTRKRTIFSRQAMAVDAGQNRRIR